jgi:hypothetical protein
MALTDTILQLTKQLYPKGRAFKMPFASDFEKLHKGLAASEARAYGDALSILNSAIPDNTSFTVDDATDWERRLGLVSNPAVSLANRKLAISRKMRYPGDTPNRANYRYLEGELQSVGFNVYVFENRFPDGFGGYITQSPGDLSGGAGVLGAQHGDFQHGDFQHGGVFGDVVVNYIDENVDNDFNVGDNVRSSFFIGANPVGTFANVDAARKDEFRQMILRIKPVQTVAFLFINYV